MNRTTTIAILITLLVVAVPVALGAKPPGAGKTPSASQYQYHPRGHAFGFFCQGESKKHVAGTRGTPFSRCVTAMAKLAHGTTKSPKVACATEPKKHVAHMKGTPFSVCVAAGKKFLHSKH